MIGYDSYVIGDEIISYSIANNDKGGFVFSEGRVAAYVKNEIAGETLSDTMNNIVSFVTDIVKNKTSADFFVYPRNPEVQLFSKEEIACWMQKNSDEFFNIGTTWLYSLSDDANSYLYYCLLNVSSSLFPNLSSTKWIGFFVNYLFYIICLICMYAVCKKLKCLNFKVC